MTGARPVVLACALALAACNKGPAQEALAVVDSQLAEARPLLEVYAPERLQTTQTAQQYARARLQAHQYTEALKQAERLPPLIATAAEEAKTRRAALVAAWTPLAGRVPLVLEGAERRAAELAGGRVPPRGLDPGRLAEVQAELRELRAGWQRASAQFESGQVPTAVRAAQEVQARVDAAAARLGLSPAAAMAVAAAETPSPPPSP